MATDFHGTVSQQQSPPGLFASLTKDLVAIASLGIILIGLHDFVPPFTRGFQCDDETIRYPYKESTISSGLCYSFGSAINVGLVLLLEYLNMVKPSGASDSGPEKFQLRLYLRNVYCRLIVWFFGAITCELITDITKVSAGRLRPHFISVCDPTIVSGPVEMKLDEYCLQTKRPYEYITNYRCDGMPGKQKDARLSFLSGHSSYSAYSATFAVLYLQSALDITKLGLIKPAAQILLISMALYTGLSRVSDYKHHWQDVLAGLISGTTIASMVSLYLWPPLNRSYTKLMRVSSQQMRPSQAGEELNRFSY